VGVDPFGDSGIVFLGSGNIPLAEVECAATRVELADARDGADNVP
jgi:hypothetical protein